MEKLLEYLNNLSKENRARFADACGTSEGYLRKAISNGQVLGVPICVAIERESGGAVTRKDLRPDDWEANWPELFAQPAPATRRADDPQPPGPDPDAEEPPSRKNLMECCISQPRLYEVKKHS